MPGTYGRVYKAVLLGPPKKTLSSRTAAALSLPQAHSAYSSAALHNPELCMRPGDLPAKENEVFAIKKFKPDKEGDVLTYAGISQSGAREIMVSCEALCRGGPVSGLIPSLTESCIIGTSWLYARSSWKTSLFTWCLSMPSMTSW